MAKAEAWVMIPKLDEKKTGCVLEMKPLVLCKDCKHRPTAKENRFLVFPDDICPCQIDDDWYSWMPKDDWFCANGEKDDGWSDY